MEYMGEEYFKLKSTVIKYERFLLKDLGFCVYVKHPHKLVVTYLQMLELQRTPLVQKAWNNMNDCLRTNVFVRFTPETIACACIFLAARHLKMSLPLRPPWWKVFGAVQKDLEAISLEIIALHSRPRKFLESLEKEISVLREKLAKKQVEIKEVNLKKITSSSSGTSSPQHSDNTLRTEEKSSSKSPLAQPSLLAAKPASANPSPLSQSAQTNNTLAPPVKNGLSKSPPSQKEDNGRKRSRSVSIENDHTPSDHSRSRSPIDKPIRSPIKISSSGSEADRPGSTSPPRVNGAPENYQRDSDSSHRRKRHKHYTSSDSSRRVEYRSKHSRSKYKLGSRDGERHRDQYRDEYDRDRDGYASSKGRRKREKDYDREYYSSSKMRKSESSRYR